MAVTSFWLHIVGSRVEIYLARWKFMLISDQAKDLEKIVLKVGLYVSFSTDGLRQDLE